MADRVTRRVDVSTATFFRLAGVAALVWAWYHLWQYILIFLAAKEQSFAIIGDSGIHERVGEEFWRLVAAHLTEHFQKKEFTEGIVDAVNEVGEQLATFFPHAGEGDRNELSNEISTGLS